MWDLFCRVVDNFGDIGVTWRLARLLHAEQGVTVRLWVDDLATFARIEPRIQADAPAQRVDGVQIQRWEAAFPEVIPGEAVIEAFGCPLPPAFLDAMAARRPAPVWVNLEYLTAEPFAAACHGLPSPHPRLPLTKHFFFPGFDARTGGVLRERGLFAARDAFRYDAAADVTRISLFSYDNAAILPLLRAWAAGPERIECLVPGGPAVARVAAFLGRPIAVNETVQAGALGVRVLPFSDQPGYDRLLWSCHWNFVRGEDSFVRAQWAGRPMVWQPYAQEGEAHLAKLEAFLDRYTAGLAAPAASAVRGLMHAWNEVPGGPAIAAAWREAAATPSLGAHARRWADQLAAGPELAATLAEFVRARLQ